jgi:lipopolysaccharide export system permease protein
VILLFGAGDRFLGRIEARSAKLVEGAWQLRDAWVSDLDGHPSHRASYSVPTTLTPARIQESFAPPDTLSFWALPGFIRTAQLAGFRATRYQLYFDSLVFTPEALRHLTAETGPGQIVMGTDYPYPFSLRLARLGGLGRVIVQSALAGFGVYFFSNVTQALGVSGILPVALAAAAPATAAILIGMTLVFHQEDG